MHTTFTDELLRVGLPIAAVVISCLSLWFTRRLWVQSNRPVVTAAVRTSSGGNESIAFDIAVINSGTRPAVIVRLSALRSHIEDAMTPTALRNPTDASCIAAVHRCFSSEGVIPLLLNGQTVTNSFGHTAAEGAGGSLWKVGATIPVEVAYSDLEGRSFRSQVTLLIRDSAGFAGSFWSAS